MENIIVGTEVLVVGSSEPRSTWRTGTVEDVHPGVDGLVRAVTIKTAEGLVQRPITKICPLLPLKQMRPSGDPLPRGMGGGMDQRLGVSSGTLENSAGLGPPEHDPYPRGKPCQTPGKKSDAKAARKEEDRSGGRTKSDEREEQGAGGNEEENQ
eukprot:TCALIF_09205-PA protein Name:"Protein of unknown function" AED:0.72 eAED:0.72 QI:0/-1/0/1/-1/1/1/0/153